MQSLPMLNDRSEGLQHMSESVFAKMCKIVGTSQQVVIRRETVDFDETVDRALVTHNGVLGLVSGSKREGFRMNNSDYDMMYWPNSHRVIMEISQSESYNTANTTLILSDSSESPPGFTLLQLLSRTRLTYREIFLACVPMNDYHCISSSILRRLTCSVVHPNSTMHGPCGSGRLGGILEYDTAHCFVCDFWPSSAFSWIDRCHSWPDPEVVDDIVRNGCHFVAIGHPLGLHEHEEWRISFSRAEYKLVASMTHCQFLTYGLLKIFLKEVINQNTEETDQLLCSYHMKTAIFWAIQQTMPLQWCPRNLLAGFWVCFKLLLKWVYKGICPNFFIPQNNLFLTKIHGSAQNRLFQQLHELYEKGLACLLQSSSIRSNIIDVFYNPCLPICTDENLIRSEIDFDLELFSHPSNFFYLKGNPICLIKAQRLVEQLIGLPLTRCQVVMLQKLTAALLQRFAFLFYDITCTSYNKLIYIGDKISHRMLKLAAEFGCVSEMLYIAMYYYKTFRYREALSVIELTKIKLSQPYIMVNRQVDRERYTEAVGGQSWSTKMRQAVADHIRLDNNICYLRELIPEQQAALQNNLPALYIPVLVMLHLLELLCNRYIDATLSQAALDELQVLIHHDNGMYIHIIQSDISWEILGICQQIMGNLQAALYSYQQSLTQYQWSRIQTATHSRIQDTRRMINVSGFQASSI